MSVRPSIPSSMVSPGWTSSNHQLRSREIEGEQTVRNLDLLSSSSKSVSNECPFAFQVVQCYMIVSVDDFDLPRASSKHLDWLNGLAVLDESWIWGMI